MPSPEPRPANPPGEPLPLQPGALYSLRESAHLLRVDRGTTLPRAIAAGLVHAVKVGRATRIPGTELLRIQRDGLPLPGGRRPPTPKRKRRAPKARPSPGKISDIPL